MSNDLKLTPKQKKVVRDVRDGGYVIITNCEMRGAIIGRTSGDQYEIGTRLFWNMVDKGLIYQQLGYPFNYVLTEKAKNIKL